MKKSILLSLLLGCIGPLFAETPDYTGLWSAFDGQGNPYYFSIAPDRTAKTLLAQILAMLKLAYGEKTGIAL